MNDLEKRIKAIERQTIDDQALVDRFFEAIRKRDFAGAGKALDRIRTAAIERPSELLTHWVDVGALILEINTAAMAA